MRRLFARFLVVLFIYFLALPTTAAPANEPLTLFPTEQQAQQHCPRYVVVWLNTASGIYHFQGQRWYGRTKNGAYACQKEADEADDHATKNGQ
jgi:hypothetical protein